MRLFLIFIFLPVVCFAQNHLTQVSNLFPHPAVFADGIGSNSETGIAALIPCADKLWAIGYVAHIQGDSIGLYEISQDMTWRKHSESVTGTFANRMVHWRSNSVIIGPHIIDSQGQVHTIPMP